MTVTPIHAVQYLAEGAKLEAVEGVLTKIYPDRKSGTNNHGEWSFQNAKLKGTDGSDIDIKFANMDLIPPEWVNNPVRFMASTDTKAKSIVVEEYNAKKRLMINRTAEFVWNPPGYGQTAGPPQGQQQAPPQQRTGPQGPPPSQHTPPPQQGPPAQRQTAAPPQQSSPPPRQQPPQQQKYMGPTIGMAVNNAVLLHSRLNHTHDYLLSKDFALDVWKTASDILRVTDMLEAGSLAPPASQRTARQAAKRQQQPTGDRRIEPDHEHDRPLNAAERAEAERRAADGRPPAFPSGNPDGLGDDEIPF